MTGKNECQAGFEIRDGYCIECGASQRDMCGKLEGDIHPGGLAVVNLSAALRSCINMLSAVAGDIEDGHSLADLRGKYVMALLNTRDDARAALTKATGGTPDER